MKGTKKAKQTEETKQCSKKDCRKVKPISEFSLQKNGKLRSYCKECGRKMCKAYKARNKEHVSEYNKEYKQEHQEDISQYNHQYNKNNREAIQKRQRVTHRIRRRVDKNYYTGTILRSRLNVFIKRGTDKGFIEDMIGCSHLSFQIWLIYQFSQEMSFENYGTYWVIDHVNPCSNFDLAKDENKYTCFHWSNLRPIEKMENFKKTNKTDQELIANQKKTAEEFLKLKFKKFYTIIV